MSISYKKNDNITVEVYEKPEEFEYHERYSTETEKTSLVKRIEALVRASLEYGDYISFLRTNIGMDACAFFNNVSKTNNRKISIEVHHAPLTLFDITKIVLDHAINEGETIDDLLISEEVMRIHYMNQVGLIPLSKTLHEVVHKSDKLVIPIYMIYGDFRSFIKKYEAEIEENPSIKKKIVDMLERTKAIKDDSFDNLKTNFTYIKVDGFEIPAKIEDLSDPEMEKLKKAAA